MLYLTNQQCSDIEMEFHSVEEAKDDIRQAIRGQKIDGDGWLMSALDDETADALEKFLMLQFPIPTIDNEVEFKGQTPDDVAITLPDNLELGDQIISVEIISGKVTFHTYTQYE